MSTQPQITAHTEITEHTPRATRLQVLEAQVVGARDELVAAHGDGDTDGAYGAFEQLATLLQHTLQELAHLAWETSPR